jgi:hypothetical protein
MVRTTKAQRIALKRIHDRICPGVRDNKHAEYAVRRLRDNKWVSAMSDYTSDESQRWVVSYATAEHLIDVRKGDGFEIVYVGANKPTYREFRKIIIPTMGCDGAVVAPFAGMFLCVERDGYTHS